MPPRTKAAESIMSLVDPKNCTRCPGTDIATGWVFVTTDVARRLLEFNVPNNRKLMPVTAGRHATEMKSGDWIVTHEGIGVDVDGFMVDGQHRLTAIAESGVGQWFLVTVNLPKSAVQVINRGRSRTLAHALQVLGYEGATTRMVAAARVMHNGVHHNTGHSAVSDTRLRKFIDDHAEAVGFGVAQTAGKKGMNAIMAGLVARAFYHHPQDQLKRFVLAVADEVPEADGRAGDKMARRLGQMMRELGAGPSGTRVVLYRKAQNVLKTWAAGMSLDAIREVEDDLYPLPGEAAA